MVPCGHELCRLLPSPVPGMLTDPLASLWPSSQSTSLLPIRGGLGTSLTGLFRFQGMRLTNSRGKKSDICDRVLPPWGMACPLSAFSRRKGLLETALSSLVQEGRQPSWGLGTGRLLSHQWPVPKCGAVCPPTVGPLWLRTSCAGPPRWREAGAGLRKRLGQCRS